MASATWGLYKARVAPLFLRAMSRRTRLIALLVTINVVLVVGGYSLIWWILAGDLAAEGEAWTERRRAEGYDASYRRVSVGGFPFAIEVVFESPRLGRAAANGAWLWQGERLSLVVLPWRLDRPTLRLDGRQHFSVSDGRARHEMTVAARRLGAKLFIGSLGQLERLAAGARDLRVEGSAFDGVLTVERLRLEGSRDWRAAGPAAISFSVLANAARLPRDATGLGTMVTRARLDAIVRGDTPPAMALVAALAAWRDDGGTVEIRTLALEWGSLDIDVEGTFALDSEMRPVGAGSATIAGHEAAIDRLIAGGNLGARDGATAKAVLNVIARLSSVDGQHARVPIRIQDGEIFLGPIAIAKIEPIVAPPLAP